MKKSSCITLLVFLGLNFNLTAQPPNFLWAKQLGGNNNTDKGYAIATDANGNVYTTGVFFGTSDFNPSTDPNNGTYNLTAVGNYDIFISKLDASGNFVWAKSFGGAFADYGYAITLDANGNVYTTGYFQGTVDFDPGNGTSNLTSSGDEDIFVSKFSPSGNFLWAKKMGGPYEDVGKSITVNAIGNVITTGSFKYVADFDPGSGINNLTLPGEYGIFISTLDASGNYLWAKGFGGPANNFIIGGYSVALDINGNVYATGNFIGIVDFDPGNGIYNLDAKNNSDIFVLKLDASGNFIWAKQIGGVSAGDYGYSIAIDPNGNVYTTGSFGGTCDFDPSIFGTYNLIGADDIFVSKLNNDGEFIWAKQMGGTWDGRGTSIAVDANENVYTAGVFYGNGNTSFDFDPGLGVYNLTSEGHHDIFISKLDPAGNFLWANRMGGEFFSESCNSLTLDPDQNIFITGSFWGTVDFDPSNGTYSLTSGIVGNTYYEDIFIEKLCELASPTITGPTAFCPGGSTTLTASSANSYLWNNGATTQSITVSTQGNYSVIVSNATACSAASPVITVIGNPTPPTPTVSAIGTTTFCQGGSVMLTSSTATSYLWSDGATTKTITVTSSGDYKVTISNAAGCTAVSTTTTTVAVNPLPNVSANASVPSVCSGSPVTLTGGGASTYTWSNGVVNGMPFVPTATITYTVTGTDTNTGCQNTATKTITVNPLPSVVANASVTSICVGSNTPVILTGIGANTYTWSNGVLNGVPFIPTATTTYTVTGTDANTGCQNTATKTITVNPLPNVGANASPFSVCNGDPVILTGTGAVSYAWSNGVMNGVPFIPTATATYTVVGTDANLCQNTATKLVVVNPLPTVVANASLTSVCSGMPVTLSGSGANSYTWSNGVANGIPFMPTVTATYTVTGTDGNGCKNNASKTIIVNPLPNIFVDASDISICIGMNITLVASGASSYTWSNGVGNGIPFPPTATTTYTVIGTDTNGCQNTASKTITVNPLPGVGANASKNSLCIGSDVTLTGSGASNYAWSNGVLNGVPFFPTSTATYAVTGTDSNGCQNTATTTITVNPLPILNLGQDINLPVGPAILDANATGQGLTYLWSNGATTAMISVSSMGTYSVTVANTFGCTATDDVVVHFTVSMNNPDSELSLTISPNPTQDILNILCEGSSTTSAQVIDNLGKIISEDNDFVADGEVRTLNLVKMPSGAYYIRVIGHGFIRTVSIIKH